MLFLRDIAESYNLNCFEVYSACIFTIVLKEKPVAEMDYTLTSLVAVFQYMLKI